MPVFSQENVHSILKDTINLDEVVVTGIIVKVNRRNVPMAVSVVNNLQLSESSESAILPILNGRVPGLFITERGVMGFGVATNAAGQISSYQKLKLELTGYIQCPELLFSED